MITETEIKARCSSLFYDMEKVLGKRLMHQLEAEGYLAGGVIRSMVCGEEIKDVDVWLRSSKLVNELEKHFIQTKNGFISNNAINFYIGSISYQIITRNVDLPDNLVGIFDFEMNMNYYVPNCNYLYIKDWNQCQHKRLVVNRACRNKVGTLTRITKFVNRGYQVPSKMDMVFLAVTISQGKSINTFEELEEVSQLYFGEADFNEADFVERPVKEEETVETYYQGIQVEGSRSSEAVSSYNYQATRSGSKGNYGSAI